MILHSQRLEEITKPSEHAASTALSVGVPFTSSLHSVLSTNFRSDRKVAKHRLLGTSCLFVFSSLSAWNIPLFLERFSWNFTMALPLISAENSKDCLTVQKYQTAYKKNQVRLWWNFANFFPSKWKIRLYSSCVKFKTHVPRQFFFSQNLTFSR